MASLEINPCLRKPENLNTMQPLWLESPSPFFKYDKISHHYCLSNDNSTSFLSAPEKMFSFLRIKGKPEALGVWCYCYGSWELQFRKQPQSCEQLSPRWTNISRFTMSCGRYIGFHSQNKTERVVWDNMKISINTYITFAYVYINIIFLQSARFAFDSVKLWGFVLMIFISFYAHVFLLKKV